MAESDKKSKSDAAETADAFLQGVKIKEVPEGRSLLAQHAWAGTFPTMSEDPDHPYPVFRAVSMLYDRLFDTDVAGVQGYRRLVELKAISQEPTKLDLLLRKKVPPTGTVTTERYLLTGYRDRVANAWRVLEFRDPSHPAEEVTYCRLDLKSNNRPELMYKYRQYGYWLF